MTSTPVTAGWSTTPPATSSPSSRWKTSPCPGPKHDKLDEDHVAKMAGDKNLPRAQATLKKGQALLWGANLLHGGGTHADKSALPPNLSPGRAGASYLGIRSGPR